MKWRLPKIGLPQKLSLSHQTMPWFRIQPHSIFWGDCPFYEAPKNDGSWGDLDPLREAFQILPKFSLDFGMIVDVWGDEVLAPLLLLGYNVNFQVLPSGQGLQESYEYPIGTLYEIPHITHWQHHHVTMFGVKTSILMFNTPTTVQLSNSYE